MSLLNSREEQNQFLTLSSDEPIYILVNGRQSPDRGVRRFFSQARMRYPAVVMVILDNGKDRFVEDWQRLARETSLPSTLLSKKD
ncbi:hypothetical protein AB8616_15345 [Marinomonas sp. RS-M-Aa-14]|uniref:hypothetical protein n=1 Tax=Marinomonas sp. RS-M-Aa-14 TaxID=3241169 RepID=UPI003AAA5753